jgi:hypothetical protein
MSAPPPATIAVQRALPIKWGYCRGCNARVEWVRTQNGKHMPVDWPLHPLATHEDLTGQLWVDIDAAQSHFVTCPQADTFRRREKTNAE